MSVHKFFTGVLFCCSFSSSAQEAIKDSSSAATKLSGYVEAYYGYDGVHSTTARPGFLYNFNRRDQLNLNLAFLKIQHTNQRFRSNLSLAAGTYMRANYAQESGIWKYILEGNIGYKISHRHKLWVDIGILPSHLGFESAIGKDNWNLTRSILAENSPYFESGAKLTYTTPDDRFTISGFVLNGWQRIRPLAGTGLQHFGMQVTVNPRSSLTLNYSNFLGSDTPDSARLFRHFHNFYGIVQVHERVGFIVGFDIGFQQQQMRRAAYDHWYSYVGIVRYNLSDKWRINIRGERYHDPSEVLIRTDPAKGFHTGSISANLDYTLFKQVLLRLEARRFKSREAIYSDQKSGYMMFTGSASIYF